MFHPSPRRILQPLVLLLGFLALRSAPAELLWTATFDSATTEASAPVINDTGANDTFTSVDAGGDATLLSATIQSGSDLPPFLKTGALHLKSRNENSSPAPAAFQVAQSALQPGPGGILILSFDCYRPGHYGYSLTGRTQTASRSRSGKVLYLPNIPDATPLRVTIVLNRSGHDLQLPGDLGTLPTDSLALYRSENGLLQGKISATPDVVSTTITGLVAGGSLSKIPAGESLAAWLDNFGIWNSPTDTVAGTSVLNLPPGTIPAR